MNVRITLMDLLLLVSYTRLSCTIKEQSPSLPPSSPTGPINDRQNSNFNWPKVPLGINYKFHVYYALIVYKYVIGVAALWTTENQLPYVEFSVGKKYYLSLTLWDTTPAGLFLPLLYLK